MTGDEASILQRAARLSPRWDWLVSNFYGPDATHPRVPGTLAVETCHAGEASARIEVSASRSRADIGRIYVLHRPAGGVWRRVGYWDGQRWTTTVPDVCRG